MTLRPLALLVLLSACTAHQPLGPMLACVSEALDSPTPAPRVVMMKRSDMLEQFGPYDSYYRAGTIYLGTRRPTAGLLAHEAARAVLASAGRPLDADSDRLARRECGR